MAVILIGGAGWYYFTQTSSTVIEKILNNPTGFVGKTVTIEGEVTDRTAFFNIVKFYKVKDQSGEITVVTKSRTLPKIKSTARVKGRIDDLFPIGDQKLTVFVEESVEEKNVNK